MLPADPVRDWRVRTRGIQAKYGADLFESTVAFPRYDDQDGRAFVAMHVAPDGYRLVVKRAIDFVGAARRLSSSSRR